MKENKVCCLLFFHPPYGLGFHLQKIPSAAAAVLRSLDWTALFTVLETKSSLLFEVNVHYININSFKPTVILYLKLSDVFICSYAQPVSVRSYSVPQVSTSNRKQQLAILSLLVLILQSLKTNIFICNRHIFGKKQTKNFNRRKAQKHQQHLSGRKSI